MESNNPARTITFLYDDGTENQTLCTADLAWVFGIAARVSSVSSDPFDLNFSSLFLGIMEGRDRWSAWFRLNAAGETFLGNLLADKRDLGYERFRSLIEMPELEAEQEGRYRTTVSVRQLINSAIGVRDREPAEGDRPLDVVHILVASSMIPRDSLHGEELAHWGLDSERFAATLQAELASATDAAANSAVPESAGTPLKGLSPHITTDRWTIDDALGYRFYAEAIARFITDLRTIPPLTISIQAPWGGGKTSLMRMIQQRLDPLAPDICPDDQGASKTGAERPVEPMTLRSAMRELKVSSAGDSSLPKVVGSSPSERQRFTVWFNAWKYESTNQVWAGLADSIIRQYAQRLTPESRERFWLTLNARRIDPDRIRKIIYGKLFDSLLQRLPLLVAFIAAASLAALKLLPEGGLFSVAGSVVAVLSTFLAYGKREADDEPVAVTLKDFLDVPDYSSDAGYIHGVADDVQRIFAATGADRDNPIVVFIDDLDRCSPGKIAQVTEAINLFLAGEFPHAVFVLGMDSEMVAAALQAAHRELIENLPPEAGTPVGWRFMDKFVQLPFHIPPAEKGEMSSYAATFFRTDGDHLPVEVSRTINESVGRIGTREEVLQQVVQLRSDHNLDERQASIVSRQLEDRFLLERLRANIATFSDDNPAIVTLVDLAADNFRGNPRELKRFINLFRFQYNLWCVRKAQDLPAPSLEQLSRWTILSIRWPEVVRWLRRSGRHEWRDKGGKKGATPTFYTRLAQLEAISVKDDIATWHKLASDKLLLDPEKVSWLNDDDLLLFFHAEQQLPAGERLSAGAGQGLW